MLGGCGPGLKQAGEAGLGPRSSCKGPVLSAPGLMPERLNPSLLSPQSKNSQDIFWELKPEPTKVRFFEAMPAAGPETHGEVTSSQGSFAVPGGQGLSQVLGDTLKDSTLSALTELHASN